MTQITFRPIQQADNEAIAKVIRTSLLDFNAAKPGTVYFDEATDFLFEVFKKEKSAYFIAEFEGRIVGGAGIYPTASLPNDTCELVKLYLHADARGKGIGKALLQKCIDVAISKGYQKMYLETMPELSVAIPLYEKFGFTYLPSAIGKSEHCGCDIWMIKAL